MRIPAPATISGLLALLVLAACGDARHEPQDTITLSVRQGSADSYFEEGGRVRVRVHAEVGHREGEGVAPFSGAGDGAAEVLSVPLEAGDYEVEVWTAPCGESGCAGTKIADLPWAEAPLCATRARLVDQDVVLTVMIDLGGKPACAFEVTRPDG